MYAVFVQLFNGSFHFWRLEKMLREESNKGPNDPSGVLDGIRYRGNLTTLFPASRISVISNVYNVLIFINYDLRAQITRDVLSTRRISDSIIVTRVKYTIVSKPI